MKQRKEPVSHILLRKHLDELGLHYETEVKFHATRKWRWDFALSDYYKIAIEIMGSTWASGRHTRGRGYQSDCDKANEGTRLSWKILRFTSEDVLRGRAKEFLKRFLIDAGRPK